MKYGNAEDDDSSLGQELHMPSCAQSYASFDETDEANAQYYTTTSSSSTFSKSYLEAVQQKPSSSPTAHEEKILFKEKILYSESIEAKEFRTII
jgi:hypothetical protein